MGEIMSGWMLYAFATLELGLMFGLAHGARVLRKRMEVARRAQKRMLVYRREVRRMNAKMREQAKDIERLTSEAKLRNMGVTIELDSRPFYGVSPIEAILAEKRGEAAPMLCHWPDGYENKGACQKRATHGWYCADHDAEAKLRVVESASVGSPRG